MSNELLLLLDIYAIKAHW